MYTGRERNPGLEFVLHDTKNKGCKMSRIHEIILNEVKEAKKCGYSNN